MWTKLWEALKSDRGRAYLHRVALASLLVVGGYGLLSQEELALWAGWGSAILSVGTATLNTSTRKPPQ